MQNKEDQHKLPKPRFLNGYRVIYLPEHPKSMSSNNWNGWIYEHIAVAEDNLGRSIRDEEVVHHLDGNKTNNRIENLLVLDRSQHARLHKWLDSGAPFEKSNGEHGVNLGKPKVNLKYCKVCSRTLQHKEKTYCSNSCRGLDNRKVTRPSKAQLELDINSMSFVAIGKKYGVSDNAIRKWAKQYNIVY